MIHSNFSMPSVKIPDDTKVFKFITRLLGDELSQLSKPCYMPKLIKYIEDLKDLTLIDDDDIKKFRDVLDPAVKNFDIYRDKNTILLMIMLINYARLNRAPIAKEVYRLLTLKFYSSLVHKQFPKFCNNDVWAMALSNLSPKHLFKVKNGITNYIVYLSDTEFEKSFRLLANPKLTDKELITIIYRLRGRLSQSLKSFAEKYYAISQQSTAQKPTEENVDSSMEGTPLIADKYSMIMCTYGQIDKDALSTAIRLSGIRKDLAITTITQMSSNENKDKLKFIIILIGRVSNLKDVCIESSRNTIMRKIRSQNLIAGRYVIKDQIKELLFSLEVAYKLKTVAEIQLITFFGHYLTIFLKNRLC